jgi:hypothetical protein
LPLLPVMVMAPLLVMKTSCARNVGEITVRQNNIRLMRAKFFKVSLKDCRDKN